MGESFKVESIVGECHVHKDVWSTTVGTSRLNLLFQPQTVLSLGGPSAKSWQNVKRYIIPHILLHL